MAGIALRWRRRSLGGMLVATETPAPVQLIPFPRTAHRQTAMKQTRSTRPRPGSKASPAPSSILDAGLLPVEEIAELSHREGRRPVPIYHAHRWFARRFSSAFRSILVASHLDEPGEFWDAYYNGVDLKGQTVLDPFVGGGTSVVEAARLGASPVGVDIDPVACAISQFELKANAVDDLTEDLKALKDELSGSMDRYYETVGSDGERRRILHAFWVQVVSCIDCGNQIEAHPHFQLAHDADAEVQWCFCRECHEVVQLPKDQKSFTCRHCRTRTRIEAGTVDRGKVTCPDCSATEKLIDAAQRLGRPTWQLFALETIPADDDRSRIQMTERHFQAATELDQKCVKAARRALAGRKQKGGWKGIPRRRIPREGRSDNRLIHYGYQSYDELFNPRQLLHLSRLAEGIQQLDGSTRDALALAFSDHLATNCMMTNYAFGWRRLAPLFSIRAYRHVSRPVEINPWLQGTGRGTFPNAVRQVQRAVEFARRPTVAHLDGGFVESGSLDPVDGQTRKIINGNSTDLKEVPDQSVDMILTDPPYFDNIAYSELSDFYLPWLQMFGLAPKSRSNRLPSNLAATSRGPQGFEVFRAGLASCFAEMRRVLRDGGRLVFSFQHRTPRGWDALAHALGVGGWQPIQVFPMLGNSSAGLHQHDGTITWDAVVVCRKGRVRSGSCSIGEQAIDAARDHCDGWVARLKDVENAPFREPDQTNLMRATLVAASLGMFSVDGRRGRRPLQEALVAAQKERNTDAAGQ